MRVKKKKKKEPPASELQGDRSGCSNVSRVAGDSIPLVICEQEDNVLREDVAALICVTRHTPNSCDTLSLAFIVAAFQTLDHNLATSQHIIVSTTPLKSDKRKKGEVTVALWFIIKTWRLIAKNKTTKQQKKGYRAYHQHLGKLEWKRRKHSHILWPAI